MFLQVLPPKTVTYYSAQGQSKRAQQITGIMMPLRSKIRIATKRAFATCARASGKGVRRASILAKCCAPKWQYKRPTVAHINTHQRSFFTTQAHYPTTEDTARFCMLCCQLVLMPLSLSARTSQPTLRCFCGMPTWPPRPHTIFDLASLASAQNG